MDENDLCSYNKTVDNLDQQYHDTQALSGVWRAVWQLLLAMLLKAVLTIFTFGIKVCSLYDSLTTFGDFVYYLTVSLVLYIYI